MTVRVFVPADTGAVAVGADAVASALAREDGFEVFTHGERVA